MKQLPTFKVHMLGGFSASYDEQPVTFGRNRNTKALKLLQILLFHGAEGISRETLLEELFGKEEFADVANNLRVTIHRLKKMLDDSPLPSFDYIKSEKGMLYWRSPMKTEIDAQVFSALAESNADDPEECLADHMRACRMYVGDFLPDAASESWVVLESLRLKELYKKTLRDVCGVLLAQKRFEEALELCAPAVEMYPLDEWQEIEIECLISLGRFEEAMQEYENTARILSEELGVSPSGKMEQLLERMNGVMCSRGAQEFGAITQDLKESQTKNGAFYCSLSSFRDTYRMVSRLIERSGQSVYLMMCSLVGTDGQPLEDGARLEQMTAALQTTIADVLRRGDSYTRFSSSQFLILLPGTDRENCTKIFERIRKRFSDEHKSWARRLDYYVSSVADVDFGETSFHFN